jgi:hypothetical protein
MTTITWLILFREIIPVYSENHMKPINTLCGQNAELLNVKVGGTYSYHCAFKCQVKRNSEIIYPFIFLYRFLSHTNSFFIFPIF